MGQMHFKVDALSVRQSSRSNKLDCFPMNYKVLISAYDYMCTRV